MAARLKYADATLNRNCCVETSNVADERHTMKDFRDLKVWTKAHELALDRYNVTESFPKHEIFDIVSQIRRAGASIGANIAEGCGRSGNGEFQRFLQMGYGFRK